MQKMLGEAYPYVVNVCPENEITEIRIRVGKRIEIKTRQGRFFTRFSADGEYIENLIKRITNNSKYAYEDRLSQGYVDYSDGIRIGVAGDGWVNNGKIIYKKIYSLCVRIPHIIEVSAEPVKKILDNFDNTLLVSPPGGGKTTLLRCIAEKLSENNDLLIIDERSEICGRGLVFYRGTRCDVIQGVPKEYAFETAIRTMSPQIVVCDELFGEKDYFAVKTLIGSGIKVAATFHSDGVIPDMLNELFYYKVFLSSKPTPGSIKSIVCGTAARGDGEK